MINNIEYSKLKLVLYPDPILRNISVAVTEFDESLKMLADRMVEVMSKNNGAGIAAVQIGVPKRIIALDNGLLDGQIIMVNPIITSKRGLALISDGCLSFPGLGAETQRYSSVTVKYQDLEGTTHEETFEYDLVYDTRQEKLHTLAIQHEVDHLEGKLFIDLVNRKIRRILESKMRKFNR